jgi:hypothetical protein
MSIGRYISIRFISGYHFSDSLHNSDRMANEDKQTTTNGEGTRSSIGEGANGIQIAIGHFEVSVHILYLSTPFLLQTGTNFDVTRRTALLIDVKNLFYYNYTINPAFFSPGIPSYSSRTGNPMI